jgi:Anti sigma-E protein RseA, N-terminal domain
MDTSIPLPSEKFELLSAYLDGEVSAAERKQVEEWLTSDAELQKTYQQMLALQGGLRSMPASPSMPTEQLVSQVMGRLDRQPKRWAWGSLGAAAALVIGALSGLLTGNQNGMMQVAQQPKPQLPSIEVPQPSIPPVAMGSGESVNPKALMIALERPPVEIPVVPGSSKSTPFDEDSVSNF